MTSEDPLSTVAGLAIRTDGILLDTEGPLGMSIPKSQQQGVSSHFDVRKSLSRFHGSSRVSIGSRCEKRFGVLLTETLRLGTVSTPFRQKM